MTQPPRDPRANAQPAQVQQARVQQARDRQARDRRPAGESPPAAQATRPPAAPRTPAPRTPSSRPHFTGRAAVVAIVLCGIALSLAYPVREYISQRRQIDQLEAQNAQIQMRRAQLQRESRLLHSPAYIAEQARDRLHMCLPTQVCYVIIGDSAKRKPARATRSRPPGTRRSGLRYSRPTRLRRVPDIRIFGQKAPAARPEAAGARGLPARRARVSHPGHQNEHRSA